MMYLSPEKYTGEIPEEQAESFLRKACRAVDSLTFNRIVERGFENLSEFQQKLIEEAVSLHADFCFNNAELLESPLSAYSISGVSMSFDRSRVVSVDSVITTSEVYRLLLQTGLCYRGVC